MAREIALEGGLSLIVDDEDFARVASLRLHVVWAFGRPRAKRYLWKHRRSATIDVGRIILDPPSHLVVDHINGDPLDNRRSNLRACTQSENKRNAACHRRSRVGYKGVYCFRGKFTARIQAAGQRVRLGDFGTPEEAARAYDAAALKYHGEFARLNFPPTPTPEPASEAA